VGTGNTEGIGNIFADPQFVNPAGGDFHLKSRWGHWTPDGWVLDEVHSPCIDAGDPSSEYAHESWPNGARVNMGAYGNTEQASKCGGTCAIPLIEDLKDTVDQLPLLEGLKDSLQSILDSAIQSLEKGNNQAAIYQLEAFIELVEALNRSGQLEAAQAAGLITQAQSIITAIESHG